MKSRLGEQLNYPSTTDALFDELCKVWNRLPDTHFTYLVRPVVILCSAKRNLSGGSVKY